MSGLYPYHSKAENTSIILANLKRQGVDGAEEYLSNAEYIFSERADRTEEKSSGTIYDLLIRLPKEQRRPAYIYREIARAVREEALLEDEFYSVQFLQYSEALKKYFTIVVDTPGIAPVGLNNCYFKTERTILHDELRFRSPPEIAIYDELCKRPILFFPNAAAILAGEGRAKKEPDFLICDKGKWGILEVMGETYHTNAVKDHDRARFFKEYGILCIEFFSASACKNSPSLVVDQFLGVLNQHR